MRSTKNLEAYQFYMEGRYYWNKRTEDALLKAITCIQRATELDPNFARAYAGLADTYVILDEYASISPKESYPKAREAALKAVQLDGALAETRTSLAKVMWNCDWDWGAAEAEFQRAIALDPNYAIAHHWYSSFLAAMNRPDQAVVEGKHAGALDPLSFVINSSLGLRLCNARRYDEAIEYLHKAIALDANNPGPFRGLALAYEMKGLPDESVASGIRAKELDGETAESLALLRTAYQKASLKGYFEQELQLLNQAKAIGRYVSPYRLAVISARLGRTDEAFQLFNEAFNIREYSLIFIQVDLWLDHLRSDPRYLELVAKLGFEK